MAEWDYQIGRFDIRYTLTSLNRFSAASREGHISRLVNIFGYFQSVTGRRKSIIVSTEDIEEIIGKSSNVKELLDKYPEASEDIDEGFLEPRGRPISTPVYIDSEHAHDHVTRRSVSGVLSFVGSAPIIWTSKRQGTIESSIYSAEFCAVPVATDNTSKISKRH